MWTEAAMEAKMEEIADAFMIINARVIPPMGWHWI